MVAAAIELELFFSMPEVQARDKQLETAAEERSTLENELCELEGELSAAQHDLKSVVGGDLQLGHALTEIEGLRKQIVQSQEDRTQMLSQVFCLFCSYSWCHCSHATAAGRER